jgi:hypothetical protein
MTKTRLAWEAHAYEYKERSQDWYWAVAIVTGALAAVAVIFDNAILGILIVVAAFALALFANREPEIVEVSVGADGVTRGGLHYPYEALRSFWIDRGHTHPRFYLRSAKLYIPLIIVPLGEADPEEIAEVLAQHLEEEHHAPPLVERLLEALGF